MTSTEPTTRATVRATGPATGAGWAAPSNLEQVRAWDGTEGQFWAAHAAHFEQAVDRYDTRLFEAAALRPTDTVLDIGCGTGSTTREAARRAAHGLALGVDLSAPMLEVARRSAQHEGLVNLRFEQADAQVHAFGEAVFDVAVSRTGAMFFGDPRAAFANIARSLRPGGRLVLLVWQPPERNEWFLSIIGALAVGRELPSPPPQAPGPFSLSDPAHVSDLLTAAGFTAVQCQALEAPMRFGSDVEDAYRLVSGLMAWMLADLDEDRRDEALAALRQSLEAHQTPAGVAYASATWLVTAQRA